MSTHSKSPMEEEFEDQFSSEKGAFSKENAEEGGFVEGDPGTTSTDQASSESEQSKEHFAEMDQLYRSALMECYNG